MTWMAIALITSRVAAAPVDLSPMTETLILPKPYRLSTTPALVALVVATGSAGGLARLANHGAHPLDRGHQLAWDATS